MIPTDPAILLSFVNTRLRDEFSSLAELCAPWTPMRRLCGRPWPPSAIPTIPTKISLHNI